MAVGLDAVVTQRDFSAGMFRGIREDLIPPNGAYDITNGLLDDTGGVYRRGGTTYRSTANFGLWLPFIWDGYLAPGQRTLVASTSAFGLLNADGSVTSLGGTGLARPGRAAAFKGVLYLPGGATYDGAVIGTAAPVADFYAVVANRLLAASGARVSFSQIDSITFGTNDWHDMPDGVQIVGLVGLRDAAVVFTTGGVWVISNMSYDLTDASGNVQHRVDRYSSDLMLWADAGIAAWEGGLIVPAVDGVWQMALGVASEAPQPFQRLSTSIDGLYRDYVRRGYTPGQACVFRSHYLLPILNGDLPVDLLVCRLDAPGRPWTHMAGFGAQLAAVTVRASASIPRRPELLGTGSVAPRVLNLHYFEPSADYASEADGSTHLWSVRTRDMATGPLNKNTIARLRMGYDLADPGVSNPTIRATHVSGRSVAGATEWGLFEWGAADWSPVAATSLLSGTAPEDPFAYEPFTWSVGKRERFGRFLLECDDPAASLTLRWLEMFVRSSGRI